MLIFGRLSYIILKKLQLCKKKVPVQKLTIFKNFYQKCYVILEDYNLKTKNSLSNFS